MALCDTPIMKVDLTTDVRIIALQSAALRLENLIDNSVVTDPTLTGQLTAMAQRLRREISLLQLNQQPAAKS